MISQKRLVISTSGKGLSLITKEIINTLDALPEMGILNIFICHTSASLLIQENADPTAKKDLETFFDLLAPENQKWHRHTVEGPDDTTSHLKAALTQTSLSIPIINFQLGLGVWQGIYLFEHRHGKHERNVVLTVYA